MQTSPLLNPNDPNVAMLELVAARLGSALCKRLVFVGGAAAGLLITDPASPPIRATEDVDVVAEVFSLKDYHALESELRQLGFVQDMSPKAPICRWKIAGVTLDVMPSEERVLGFANRWYPLCVKTANAAVLPSEKTIKLILAPVFIATKLEAFKDRGAGDYLFSHDLGDILSVMDGRAEILNECSTTESTLRIYLAQEFSKLLEKPAFIDALPGHLPPDTASQERLPWLIESLRKMSQLKP